MTITSEIQEAARQMLSTGQASVVIGYEVGPRGRTRPAFVRAAEDIERLVWNRACTHNLTVYLTDTLRKQEGTVAIVVKPCDSRAVNVLLAEQRVARNRLHVIGVACEGILDADGLQDRCQGCVERTPVVYDTLIGEPPDVSALVPADSPTAAELARLDTMTPAERMDFWLGQFDRCIRCYACRQACPMCDCPTCLYERDDSLWVGARTGLDEKRAFHLGRAYHLAGRCIGCDECQRACPMDIPISLLNRKLAQEIEAAFGYRAGLEAVLSPITTMLQEGGR